MVARVVFCRSDNSGVRCLGVKDGEVREFLFIFARNC